MEKTRKEASLVSVGTLITVVGLTLAGGRWVGALDNEVEDLKEETDKIEEVQKEVQEISKSMTEVQTTQRFVLQEQSKQDKKLDKILEKLEEMD